MEQVEKDYAVTVEWLREQVGFRIVQLKADALKRVEKIFVVIIVGYRLYDDIIAGVMAHKDDPAYNKDFALVKGRDDKVAVHFMGAAVMAGSREEMIEVPSKIDPDKKVKKSDPGYVHPWSYRLDWFVTERDSMRVHPINLNQGKIVLCPEDKRLQQGEEEKENG
jgi:hypothetical protein